MTVTVSAPFHTNPSTIARYFFHDCERFLYYSSAGKEQRKSEGIPDAEFDHSPFVEAILSSGFQWEEEIVKRILKGRVVIAPGSGELHTRRLSPEQTLRVSAARSLAGFSTSRRSCRRPSSMRLTASTRIWLSSATTTPTSSPFFRMKGADGCCA